MSNDLVSIIMLSHESGRYLLETIESVKAQTYTNWELLFVDDNSQDDTISQMMELMGNDKRFNVMRTVYDKGYSYIRNKALKCARGRWISFLDVGDTWTPDKLEKQILFMEENGYFFSYTEYGVMDQNSKDRGVVVSGKEHIAYQDMLKCCWPGYLTVMYDAQKVGKISIRNQGLNNDYALWLNISEKVDCHLLSEKLAMLRTKWNLFGNLFLTPQLKWRYDSYRVEKDLCPIKAFLFTIRNGIYGFVKWFKYVQRT